MNENVPIRVFNTNLELLGEVDDYLQASFTRRWHTPGEFEIFISNYSSGAQLLRKNNIIMFGSDTTLTGIIKHREIGMTQEGKASEIWTIQGVSLGGITKQRITIPDAGQAYLSFSGAIETIMKGLVDKNLISVPTIRKIATLDLEEDSLRGESISYQSRYKNLAEDLEALSVLSGLGWEIVPDFSTKRLTFKVSVGVNRVYGQTTNPPVIFSPEFDAIKEQRFRDSDLGFKNGIYVAGTGEGADRLIEVVYTGTPEGLELSEHFQDARDLETTQELITRGQQKLQEFNTEKVFEVIINEFGSFKYRQDWDLGDLITIQNKVWGETMDARIISVTEAFTPQGHTISVGLGNQYPNLIAQLKKEFDNFDNEIRR